MLFSEPKIPQCGFRPSWRRCFGSFSALQRAENSSIHPHRRGAGRCNRKFQCSSASRKFLNTGGRVEFWSLDNGFSALQRAENSSMRIYQAAQGDPRCFSALQRAENSSIVRQHEKAHRHNTFQCSSASRKFLNMFARVDAFTATYEFQCSSASRKFLNLSGISKSAPR